MIEREKKRAKIVEKYAAKRAALKAAGDYEGLCSNYQQMHPATRFTKPLQLNWSSPRLYAQIRYQPYCVP